VSAGLDQLAAGLRRSTGVAAKQDLSRVLGALAVGAAAPPGSVLLGDDCAAIPDEAGGWMLLAIEGFINRFVEQEPWFAGWCGVMVNLSDVAAMGGRPIAVVDALWSRSDAHGRRHAPTACPWSEATATCAANASSSRSACSAARASC
jgi:uncharacterized protein